MGSFDAWLKKRGGTPYQSRRYGDWTFTEVDHDKLAAEWGLWRGSGCP